MKTVLTHEEALVARYELECFMLGTTGGYLGSGGEVIARIPPATLEWSVAWGKLVLTWWNEDSAQSLRITGYEIEPERAILIGGRGLRTEPVRLVIDRAIEGLRPALEIAPTELTTRRTWYSEKLAALVSRSMPEVRVEGWSVGADHRNRAPGRYARLRLRRGAEMILGVGVSEAEERATIDGLIAAGLTWLHNYNQNRSWRQGAQQLWFFFPQSHRLSVTARLPFIKVDGGRIPTGCFEVDELRGEVRWVQPFSQFELLGAYPDDLLWPEHLSTATLESRLDRIGREWHRRIIELAPDLIEPRFRPGRRLIGYAIHGLEFARLPVEDGAAAEFGVTGDPERLRYRGTSLTARSFPQLHQLVRRLLKIRRAGSDDRHHPFYRLRTEGWLESMLRRDIRALDPRLDSRFVYSQVPAWHADERSVIDLLTVVGDWVDDSDRGRLVVIEIKAAEDPQLPLQGLDYWRRVEQARLRGEFGRRGLFAGARIASRSPKLYLVAPRLCFHRSFSTIARCLDHEVDGFRIGLNSDWRSRVRVRSFDPLRRLE
ncbi:MAG: hypothetical protein EBU88_07575 [Acidobacteria bacterium]|nr:hypothetical protein [Acidobacteriota bacterium]